MADVFSNTFASAEQHLKWSANQFAWDPSQLHVLPSSGSQGTASDGVPSDRVSEGPGSSSGGQRDQSLGPVPIGWQDLRSAGGGAGPGVAGSKEAKGATRAPKGPLVCQVEGCGHDLSLEKGYYQRYRVCEPHMKLLSLVTNGKPCRFCQQCGRFQELTEFDGNKRSCRARLLQHNARRRKRDPLDTARKEQPNSRKSKSLHPWSDSSNDADVASGDVGQGVGMADKSHSMDSGGDQGVKVRMTSYGHVSPISTGAAPSWPGMHEAVEGPSSVNQLQPIAQQSHVQDQQQQLLQQQAVNMDLVRCFSGGSGSLDEMIDGILGGSTDYLDDPRMSLPQAAADMRGSFTGPSTAFNTSLGNVQGGMPYDQQSAQLVMSLGVGAAAGHNGSVAVGQGGFNSSAPSSGAWQASSSVISESAGASASDLAAALNKRAMQQRQLQEYQSLQQHQQLQQQQLLLQHEQQLQLQQHLQHQHQQFGGLTGRSVINTAASSTMTYMNSNASVVSGNGVGSMNSHAVGSWAANNTSTPASGPRMLSGGVSLNSSMVSGATALNLSNVSVSAPAPGTSSFDLARRLVASGGAAAQYQSEDLLVRVSIKIANCTPDQLPPDLYQRLRNLLNTADASLVQGFLRPGCTHLVLDLVHTNGLSGGCHEEPVASSLPLSVMELRSILGPAASRSAMIVQTDEQVALWPSGAGLSERPEVSVSVKELQASGRIPVIQHVSVAAHVNQQGIAVLLVYGLGLTGSGVELFARMQGGYLPLSVQALFVGGQKASSAAEDPSLAATAAAAARCAAALCAAGRYTTDVMLVTVEGAPGTGLLLLEAQSGPLLSNWCPCLLSTDGGIAMELSALGSRLMRAGPAALASLEVFVTDLGRVLDQRSYYYKRASAVRTVLEEDTLSENEYAEALDESLYDPEVVASQQHRDGDEAEDVTFALVCVCERLLGWAADAGMAHVSTFLASALRQYGQDVKAILEAPYADGLNVIHRCIRSGSRRVVRAMIDWAAASRITLGWGSLGAVGLSPLHLAALVPVMWRPLAAIPVARLGWASAAASLDSATPAQLQRLLLSRLPPGSIPKELVEVFLEQLPRTSPPATAAETPTVAASSQFTKRGIEAAAAGAESSAIPGTDEKLACVHHQHASLPAALSVLGALLVLSTAAVLFAIQPLAQHTRGPSRSTASSSMESRFVFLQRLAPVIDQGLMSCCSSMLYIGLLGLAVFFLPVKTATTLLSRVQPASACLSAP